LVTALPALAQQASSNKIAAEALFDRGLALMQQGKYDEACIQLEESQRLEGGIGTMLYLAECYERLGRIATAWALFREAASAAGAEGQADRAGAGAARAQALEPRLPKLTLRALSQASEGLEVTRNDVPVQASLFGIAVPVDPGEHTIEASAPGRLPWSTVVAIQEGAALSVEVPALETDPNAAVAEAPLPGEVEVTLASSDQPLPPRSSWQPTLGIVVGAAGLVAIGVGSYFGLRAISKKDDADARCEAAGTPGAICADARGVSLNDEAQDAATIANVLVIGGAALAVTGAVLYLTAPSPESPALALTSNGIETRMLVQGVF
jgi:serine/threonine-protein kinase